MSDLHVGYSGLSVTHTGGKFTNEAADISGLVLKMQNRAIEQIKPIVHWEDMHILGHGFLALGVFTPNDANPELTLFESGFSSIFFSHSVSHSLWLDVHDMPCASKLRPKNTEGTLRGEGDH